MTPLDAFLKAEDLDELLRAREDVSSLTPDESARVVAVIQGWSDHQAVANLLFHPVVMPASIRFEALDRGLCSRSVPYFVLAATVGLQGIPLAEVPGDRRAAWTETLLGLVQSTSRVLAGRASVTLGSWSEGAGASDILPKLLALYPVPDEGACQNIVAVVLAAYGDLPADEFDRRLTELRVSGATATALRNGHQEYGAKKGQDQLRAMCMKVTALIYIPNLSDGVDDNVPVDDLETGIRIRGKPWWQFW